MIKPIEDAFSDFYKILFIFKNSKEGRCFSARLIIRDSKYGNPIKRDIENLPPQITLDGLGNYRKFWGNYITTIIRRGKEEYYNRFNLFDEERLPSEVSIRLERILKETYEQLK